MRVRSELEVMLNERQKEFGRKRRMHSETMSVEGDGVLGGSMARETVPNGGTSSTNEE